jgi:hypothetical protein
MLARDGVCGALQVEGQSTAIHLLQGSGEGCLRFCSVPYDFVDDVACPLFAL